MKKVILFISLAVMALTANSQSLKVESAASDLRNKRLDRAKTNIDDASENENTKNDAKTWHYKAAIYYEIATTDKEKYKKLSDNALQVAVESALKCMELDKNNEFSKENTIILKNASIIMYNSGVTYFENADYINALSSFESVIKINQDRESSIQARNIAGLSAEMLRDTATAIKYYQTLVNSKFDGNRPYSFTYQIYRIKNDTTKSFDIANKWTKNMPRSLDAYIALASTYAWTKNASKTDEILKSALSIADTIKDPKFSKADFFTKMGGIYEQLGDTEKAKAKYQDALKVDPNLHSANFFLGALYFNQGVDKTEEANKTNDNALFNKLMDDSKKFFADAIPYLEKAVEINPRDLAALRALQSCYVRVDNSSKAAEIKAKIDALAVPKPKANE